MHRRTLDVLRTPAVLPASLALLALLVGCTDLGRSSLWLDEAVSVDLADRPFGGFLDKLMTSEANQSLYFVLLRIWPFHGAGEFGARLLSVLFTVATVPLLYELGRRLVDRATGAAAAVLIAVLPFALQATQEARGYSLLMLLATASTLAMVLMADESAPRAWVGYGVCTGLMAYTHVYGVFIVLGQLVWAAFTVRNRRQLLRAVGIAVVVAAPMGLFVVLHGTGQLWFLTSPDAGTVALAVTEFGAGSAPVGVTLLLAGLAGALIGLVNRTRSTTLLLCWIGAGAAVPIAFSLLVSDVFQARYLAGLLPAYALLVATLIREIPTQKVRTGVVAGLAIVLLLMMPGHYGPLIHEDWRGAMARVDRSFAPGDQVLAYPTFEAVAINAYRGDVIPAVDPDRLSTAQAARVWVIGRAEAPEMPGYVRQSSEEVGLIHIAMFVIAAHVAR